MSSRIKCSEVWRIKNSIINTRKTGLNISIITYSCIFLSIFSSLLDLLNYKYSKQDAYSSFDWIKAIYKSCRLSREEKLVTKQISLSCFSAWEYMLSTSWWKCCLLSNLTRSFTGHLFKISPTQYIVIKMDIVHFTSKGNYVRFKNADFHSF